MHYTTLQYTVLHYTTIKYITKKLQENFKQHKEMSPPNASTEKKGYGRFIDEKFAPPVRRKKGGNALGHAAPGHGETADSSL